MNLLARIVRYIFWILIVSWSVALLRRLVRAMAGGATSASPYAGQANTASQKLVRDPVCGMHVAEGLALPYGQGDETQFFCSAECRDKYAAEIKKLAANG